MALTIKYGWFLVDNVGLGAATASADVTALANGGFAAVGAQGGAVDGVLFDGAANQTGAFAGVTGAEASLDQLANGNLVIATQAAGTVRTKILDGATGADIVASTSLNDADLSGPDVAALAGGRFVVVAQDEKGARGRDADIDVFIRAADGAPVKTFSIDSTATRDIDPCVTALDNGNFAVAWVRIVATESEIWRAVYDADGGVVAAPALVDTTGTINRNPDIAASAGGFVIVYEDNGRGTGSIDITGVHFTADGQVPTFSNISNPSFGADSSNEENPTISRMSNGFLVAAWSNNRFADTDVVVQLLGPLGNPFSSASLRRITGGEQTEDDVDHAALAGLALGRIAVYQSDLTDGAIDGEVLQARRQTTGDGADDSIVGDDLVDIVSGGGGDDTLDGRGNADTLTGGAGDDTFVNPTGDTVVEAAGQANGLHDLILSDASYNLASAPNVEDVVLTGTRNVNASGGNGNNRLTGNAGDNILNGGGGNDTLNGRGGADTMNGGTGDDTYASPDADDIIVEAPGAAGGAHDRILTIGSFSIGALADVEDITLVGAADVNAIGNNAANIFTGNSGRNILNGGGGGDTLIGNGGDDTMNGGQGADLFKFATTGAGDDTIDGFSTADDRFDLAGGTFASRTESAGNTTLTHDGGTILVTGVTGLSLVQWKALVVGAAREATAHPAARDIDWGDAGPAAWRETSGTHADFNFF